MFRNLFTRKSDESQAPSRRKPFKGFGGFLEYVIPLVVLVAIFPIFWSRGYLVPRKSDPVSYLLPAALLVVACSFGLRFLQSVRGRLIMSRGSATATARILHREVRESTSGYGRDRSIVTSYHILFEYTPMLAESSSGSLKLKATVNKKIYESLWPEMTATITYATQDPLVVLLEGE